MSASASRKAAPPVTGEPKQLILAALEASNGARAEGSKGIPLQEGMALLSKMVDEAFDQKERS